MEKTTIILIFVLLLFFVPKVFAIDECNTSTDCGYNGCSNDCFQMECINPLLDNSTCNKTTISCSDGSSCGDGKYCCSGICNYAPTCSGCQYTGTCCSGTSAVCCNYGTSHLCDLTWKCCLNSGDDYYPSASGNYDITLENDCSYRGCTNSVTFTCSGSECNPSSNATLTIYLYGDYNSGSEYANIYVDGNYIGKANGGHQCSQWDSDSFTITMYDLTKYFSDGSLTVQFSDSSGVNCCCNAKHKAELKFTYKAKKRCQGYCDGFGNCDYADNCEDCGEDTCYDSGSNWFIKEYVIDYESCFGGNCLPDITYNDTCDGDIVHDRQCSGNDLGPDAMKNCNDYDGWYNYGDYGPGCLNMDDPTAEYRDYFCADGACTYSVTSTKDCDSSDGWYGGGNTAGCGSDPSSQKRDYYVNSSGGCTYTITNCQTKNCDSLDICSNICNGSVIKSYKDYYVIPNSNTCTYIWGPTVEDCASKSTYESDSCWAYTTGGYIYDYITCSGVS